MKAFHQRFAACLALALLMAWGPAQADSGTVSVGYGARFVGMAGAGLALTDNPTQAALLNPAAYALRGSGLGIQWPGVSAGVSSAALGDALEELEGDSVSAGTAEDLAIKLGQEPTRLQLQVAPIGLAFGTFGIGTGVNADVFVSPRGLFTRFANSGQSIDQFGTWVQSQPDVSAPLLAINPVGLTQQQLQTQVTAAVNQIGAQLGADVAGVAAAGASVGFGMRLPGERLKDVAVGVRLKAMRLFYSHWVVQPAVEGTITAADFDAAGSFTGYDKVELQAVAGAELGGEDSIEESAYGVDFGALWQPEQLPRMAFALTIDNLIEPDFRVPANAVGVPATGKKLMPRTLNIGAAYQAPLGLLLAADLIDITGATDVRPDGEMQFRLGAEWRPPVPLLRYVTIQGGYSSASGPAAGISFCPGGVRIGIAVAQGLPLMASQSFNF